MIRPATLSALLVATGMTLPASAFAESEPFGEGDPALPHTPAARTECGIWLCLPAGFLPSECDDPRKEMLERILKAKSPLPSWGSCFTDEESGGMRARLVTSQAAYMGGDTYIDGTPCMPVGGLTIPRGCLGNARMHTMVDGDGQQIGETHYDFVLGPTEIVIAYREIEECDDELEFGTPGRCTGRLVFVGQEESPTPTEEELP